MATPTSTPALDEHQESATPPRRNEGPTPADAAWPKAACSEGAVRTPSDALQEDVLNSVPPSALGMAPGKTPAQPQASALGPSGTTNVGQAGIKTWGYGQASAAAAATAAAATAAAAAATASAAAAAAAAASASAAGVNSTVVAGDVRVATTPVVAATSDEAGSRLGGPGVFVSGEEVEVKAVDAGAGAVASPPSLAAWLNEGPFVLSMSPGFFGFYAHIGALIALEDAGLLQGVSYATGASAGGLIAGLFAAGLSPAHMGETVVKFRRSDFWDPVGFGGLLRGNKFENIVNATLPAGVRRFDQCRIPLAVSAFDVSRLTTRTLEEGHIAQALRATCTFPGLFAPVWHERGVLVDGGIRDTSGMWCVPEGREDCRRILNVTFGHRDGRGVCVPPSSFPAASNPRPATDGMEIVTLPLTGLPRPHPFAMERGADAMEAARSQVAAVLGVPLLEGHEASHWVAATEPAQAEPPPLAAAADQEGNLIKSGKSCVANDGNAAAFSGGSSTNGHQGGAAGAEVGVEVDQASSSHASSGSSVKVDIDSGFSRGSPDAFGSRSGAPTPATIGDGAGQAMSACVPVDIGGFPISAGSSGVCGRDGGGRTGAKAEVTSPAGPFMSAKMEADGVPGRTAPNIEIKGNELGRTSKRGHQPSCDARGEGKAGVQLVSCASDQQEGANKKRRLGGQGHLDDGNINDGGASKDDGATPDSGAKMTDNDAAAAAVVTTAVAVHGEGNAGGDAAASDDPENDMSSAAGAAAIGGVGGTKNLPTVPAAGASAEESLKRSATLSAAGAAEGEEGEAEKPTRTSKRARRPKVMYPIEL